VSARFQVPLPLLQQACERALRRHQHGRQLGPLLPLLVERTQTIANACILRVERECTAESGFDAIDVGELLLCVGETERNGHPGFQVCCGGARFVLRRVEQLLECGGRAVPGIAGLCETRDRLESAAMVRVSLEDLFVRLEGAARVLHA